MLSVAIQNEAAASRLMSGNWDELGSTSIHLPAPVARRLLDQRGWTFTKTGGWVSPNGTQRWEIDEALTLALVSESTV